MRRLKTIASALAVALVVVAAIDYTASAATGKAFILGKLNKANQQTILKRTTSGPALNLTTTTSASAPMTLNGRGRVANLNADLVDGVDSTTLKTTSYVYTTAVDSGVTDVIIAVPLPTGKYLVSYSATALNAGTNAGCVLDRHDGLTVTEFGGGGFAGPTGDGMSAGGSGFVAKSAGVTLTLHCFGGTDLGTYAGQPIQIVATKVDTVAATAALTPLP